MKAERAEFGHWAKEREDTPEDHLSRLKSHGSNFIKAKCLHVHS